MGPALWYLEAHCDGEAYEATAAVATCSASGPFERLESARERNCSVPRSLSGFRLGSVTPTPQRTRELRWRAKTERANEGECEPAPRTAQSPWPSAVLVLSPSQVQRGAGDGARWVVLSTCRRRCLRSAQLADTIEQDGAPARARPTSEGKACFVGPMTDRSVRCHVKDKELPAAPPDEDGRSAQFAAQTLSTTLALSGWAGTRPTVGGKRIDRPTGLHRQRARVVWRGLVLRPSAPPGWRGRQPWPATMCWTPACASRTLRLGSGTGLGWSQRQDRFEASTG